MQHPSFSEKDNFILFYLSSVHRDWSSFDIDSFRSVLASSKLVVKLPDTCDQFFMLYDSTLNILLDDVVPLKQPAANRRRAPWYNVECRTIKAKTRRLEKIHRQKHNDETKTAWLAQFSLQCSMFQRLHAEYWSAAIQECPDSQTLWHKFDSLLQPSRQTATPFTADDIGSYFSSKIDAIRLTTATVPPPVITAHPVQPLLDFDPVTDDEVAKLLKSVANKQCALDPVSTWLVQAVH